MNRIIQFFIVGALVVAAIKLFHWEQKFSDNIVDRAKAGVQGRDPEQIVVALALTTALGVAAVIAATAFKKVT
jgi:ABC-type Mn2+/Zn2+ transport system permease subunit